MNFNKTDWTSFEKYSEEIFATASLTTNVHASEKLFRSIINKASKKFIPAGRIPNVTNAMHQINGGER